MAGFTLMGLHAMAKDRVAGRVHDPGCAALFVSLGGATCRG